MAGGEPRLGATATYMRHNDHGTTRLSTEIDILHDRRDNEYRVFSAGSVRKWSKFGLTEAERRQCVAAPATLSLLYKFRAIAFSNRFRLFGSVSLPPAGLYVRRSHSLCSAIQILRDGEWSSLCANALIDLKFLDET